MKKTFVALLVFISLVSVNLGIYSQPMSNNQYSIAKLKKDLQENKNEKPVYMALIYLYSEEGEYANMFDLMQKVSARFKNDPKVSMVFNNYAKDYFAKGNYDLAEKIVKHSLKYDKKDADAALILNEVLLKQNKIEEDISFLESFLKTAPDEMLLYERLFDLYIYKNDSDRAFDTARRALENNLDTIYFYFLQGMALQTKDLDAARTYYKAYFDKLKMLNDYDLRIKVANKVEETLNNRYATVDDYKNLINYVEKLNPPGSYVLVQARFGQKLFPGNTYFSHKINKIYSDLGLSQP